MDMNILVVDDDDVLRRELSEWLSQEGYVTKSAGSGQEAVDMVQNQDFNLILTDLKMPGMSGMELLKAVKRLRPNARMVMITAYGTIDTAVEAMKVGADDYICKPFEMEQLRSVLDNVAKTIEFERQIEGLKTPLEAKSRDPYEFFKSALRGNRGLVITPQDPREIRERHDFQNVSLLWLTPDETRDSCIHPKNLYGLKLIITSFYTENPEGVVLIEGIEGLIEQHSWEIVKKFISEIINKTNHEPSQLIFSMNPNRMKEGVIRELKYMIGGPYIQLISESLSSPIRRNILRFLSQSESSSFTGILKELQLMEAPKLSFHLKKLVKDRMVSKDKKEGYSLTERGKSVVEYLSALENEIIFNMQKNVSLILGSNSW